MSITLTSPVTGSAQTGLTSPTYTAVSDVAPDVNAKQYAITALGGTQAGVTTHSSSSPFTVTFWRPKVLKVLQVVAGQTSLVGKVPVNSFSVITRKGVLAASGQPAQAMVIKTIIEVPAGADVADANSVRAALSAHIGSLSQQSAGTGDLLINGVL